MRDQGLCNAKVPAVSVSRFKASALTQCLRRELVTVPHQGELTMRTRLHILTALPLLIFASACADQILTAPGDALSVAQDEASFNKKGGGASGSHEIILLGNLNNHSASSAVDINESNVIAGASWNSGSSPNLSTRVFRWTEGAMEDLGDGQPKGINNAGTVVGWAYEDNGWPLFVVQDGNRTQLEAGLGFGDRAFHMINDAGTVIGHRGTVGDDGRLWTAGYGVWEAASYGEQPTTFGVPAWCTDDPSYSCGSPVPFSINNDGAVVGEISVTHTSPNGSQINYALAVIWSGGNYGDAPVWLQRGPGGSIHRFARGVNDSGWIVGAVGLFQAAVWIPDVSGAYGTAIELPHTGRGWAYAASGANESGSVTIVGEADGRAVMWTISQAGVVSGPTDLGTPKSYATAEARAINSNGWIVGRAASRSGSTAVLWRPVQTDGDDSNGDDGGTAPCTHPKGKCN